MLRVVLVLVLVGLLVYAFTDCAMASEEQTAGVPKIAWLAIIVVVPILGPLVWLFASRSAVMSQDALQGSSGTRRARPAARRGPVAPDDDPDFLEQLSEQNRREQGKSGGENFDGPS